MAGKNNKEIVVRVGANTAEFNKAMKGMVGGINTMQKQLSNLGGMFAGVFSVGAITAFGDAVFTAMSEQEKANKKLMASVQGNAYAYDELSKQAEKLRSQTGIEDDTIMQIQQLAVSAGHSTENVKKLTTASVQLSVKTGGDLQSAYTMLEKSMSGVGKGLKVLGPEFAGLTKEQLMNGDAIDLVISKYGTFAEDTVLKSELLKSNFGELKESIGYAFDKGGFSPALDMLNKMVLAASDLVAVYGKFGGSASKFQTSKEAQTGNDVSFSNFKKNADKKIEADKEWANKALPLLEDRLKKQQDFLDGTKKEIESTIKLQGITDRSVIDKQYESKLIYQQSFIENTQKEIGYAKELQSIVNGEKDNNLNNGKGDGSGSGSGKGAGNTNIKEKVDPSIQAGKDFEDNVNRKIAIATKGAEEEKALADEIEKYQLDTENDIAKNMQLRFDAGIKGMSEYLQAVTQVQEEYHQLTTDQYTLEAERYQEMLDKKLISEEQYNEMIAKLKDEQTKYALQQTADMLGQASALFAENTVAFKALASAQALINTYLGASAAYSAMAGIPVVGPALGALAAAVAVASGLANVAKINGVGLAEGGIVPSGYPNDSYPAMLTSGETVVPAKRLPDFQAQAVQVYGVIKAGDIYLSNKRGAYLQGRKS